MGPNIILSTLRNFAARHLKKMLLVDVCGQDVSQVNVRCQHLDIYNLKTLGQ